MTAIIFSIVCFFTSFYMLVKGELISSAVAMGFSIIWYLLSYMNHKHNSMINYISNKTTKKEDDYEFLN